MALADICVKSIYTGSTISANHSDAVINIVLTFWTCGWRKNSQGG